jgi:hypothetical protein
MRRLTAAGLRTERGRPVSLQTFRSLLRNPVFVGIVEIRNWGCRGAATSRGSFGNPCSDGSRGLDGRVRDLKSKLDRTDEAFLHERSIDRETYERQRDYLRERFALAEMELSDAVLEDLDVQGVLAFAEHLLANAARLWSELKLERRQQFQQILFPAGLPFDGEKFGTALTCLAFKRLGGNGEAESNVASPTGFEPVF